MGIFVGGGGGGGGTLGSDVDLASAEVTGILPNANQGAQTLLGDVTGNTAASVVSKVNGIAVSGTPAAGAALRATSASAAAWGQLDLADTDAVTGVLPKANQGAQDMAGDVTGTTAASVVSKVNGVAVTGTPGAGMIPVASSASAAAWALGFPAGQIIWSGNSSNLSDVLSGSELVFVPLGPSTDDKIHGSFIASGTGTVQLSFYYSMSGAHAGGVRLRFDVLKLSIGDNPTTAATLGTQFTHVPGSDVLLHKVDSSHSADFAVAVTKDQLVKFALVRLGTDATNDTHTGDMRMFEGRAL